MKLDKLWIEDFKNLKDFSVDFDENLLRLLLAGTGPASPICSRPWPSSFATWN